jgi:DNA topoisomerase-3
MGPGFAPPPGRRKRRSPASAAASPPDGVEAAAIVARARSGKAAIASIEAETRKHPPAAPLRSHRAAAPREPPLWHERPEDPRRRPGPLRAHKLLSYPRTDSRHLSTDVAATLGAVVAADRGPLSRPARPRHRQAAPRPALRRRQPTSPITTPSSPPPPPRRAPRRATSEASTTSSAAASSPPGTRTTCTPPPR